MLMKDLAIKIGSALLVVFAPIQSMLLATLALIVTDAITGVIAAYKLGTPITSAGLRRSVSKVLVYEFAIAVAYVAQHYLMGDTVPAANIVASFVGLTELKSILENVEAIKPGMLKDIISKIGSANDTKPS